MDSAGRQIQLILTYFKTMKVVFSNVRISNTPTEQNEPDIMQGTGNPMPHPGQDVGSKVSPILIRHVDQNRNPDLPDIHEKIPCRQRRYISRGAGLLGYRGLLPTFGGYSAGSLPICNIFSLICVRNSCQFVY
jgi:hypothetical protein